MRSMRVIGKFIITYNNDPYICSLAEKYGFDTFVKERLHKYASKHKTGRNVRRTAHW